MGINHMPHKTVRIPLPKTLAGLYKLVGLYKMAGHYKMAGLYKTAGFYKTAGILERNSRRLPAQLIN